jgi:hypothetical protein
MVKSINIQSPSTTGGHVSVDITVTGKTTATITTQAVSAQGTASHPEAHSLCNITLDGDGLGIKSQLSWMLGGIGRILIRLAPALADKGPSVTTDVSGLPAHNGVTSYSISQQAYSDAVTFLAAAGFPKAAVS